MTSIHRAGGSRLTKRRILHNALDAAHLPIALYLAYIGAATIVEGGGSPNMSRALPEWLNAAWSVALIVGAVHVVAGTVTERTRAESAGHGFHLFGIGLFVLVNLAIIDGGDVVVVIVLAAVSAMRMRVLSRARRAQREAARILAGGA